MLTQTLGMLLDRHPSKFEDTHLEVGKMVRR